MLCATTPTSAKRIVHFKLQILRLEERCTRHIPQSATFLSSSAPSLPKIHCKEAKECHAANFAKLRFVLQEGEVLEASTRRVRSQRAPTGITKVHICCTTQIGADPLHVLARRTREPRQLLSRPRRARKQRHPCRRRSRTQRSTRRTHSSLPALSNPSRA